MSSLYVNIKQKLGHKPQDTKNTHHLDTEKLRHKAVVIPGNSLITKINDCDHYKNGHKIAQDSVQSCERNSFSQF